jgi:hypothetical protein
MRAFAQIVTYMVSFFTAFVAGGFFSVLFGNILRGWQAVYLGNKPLPVLSQFFVDNNELPFYLLTISWLVYFCASLLSSGGRYFDIESFILRSVVFWTVEMAVVAVLAMAALMPWITIITRLHSVTEIPEPRLIEYWANNIFWALVLVIVCLFVRRIIINLRKR